MHFCQGFSKLPKSHFECFGLKSRNALLHVVAVKQLCSAIYLNVANCLWIVGDRPRLSGF